MIKINNKTIQISKFPNGEALIDTDILNEYVGSRERIRVDFKWINDEDILHLHFVLQHLRQIPTCPIDLYIQYMPYSRMDRSQGGNCFTLYYLSDIINGFLLLNDKVYIVEPHSETTLNLIENSSRINVITPLMLHVLMKHPEIDVICYPDKGAKLRFQDDSVRLPVVFCNKVRDFATGEIKGLELDGNTDVKDKNILILDDLCSKGGTFYHTANKLKEHGAKDVYLAVCHMEKSVEDGYLLELYDRPSVIKHIYCMDTMLNERQVQDFQGYKNMTVYNIEKFLNESEVKQ